MRGITDRFRVMWRTDPSSSMVIGWDQISGSDPILYYDVIDFEANIEDYQYSKKPSRIVQAKGMNNHFVRLRNLRPNTTYYFVIQDSEGVSRRLSFRTAPDTPSTPISIVAGGDSRNNRNARRKANLLVSKLRPGFIMFSGDMTNADRAEEWIHWFDDWQLTISQDGSIYPVIVARGNHEADNAGLNDLFDIGQPNLYYTLTLGGSLLKIYTLNTMMPSGGEQKNWLAKDLANSQNVIWKFAQYHNAMRPHNANKKELNELILHWATLFHKYQVNLALESDAHCVKWTYPIRPSRAEGSDEGFIRDDAEGTVYVGEGGWGAPLRANNDDKAWTRNSDSFHQFKWIFVSQQEVAIRTIMTDLADGVSPLEEHQRFQITSSIRPLIWAPSNGSVITLRNKNYQAVNQNSSPPFQTGSSTAPEKTKEILTETLEPDLNSKTVLLEYSLNKTSDIEIILLNESMTPVSRFELKDQLPGLYEKSIDFSKIRPGKYQLIIKGEEKVIKKYDITL